MLTWSKELYVFCLPEEAPHILSNPMDPKARGGIVVLFVDIVDAAEQTRRWCLFAIMMNRFAHRGHVAGRYVEPGKKIPKAQKLLVLFPVQVLSVVSPPDGVSPQQLAGPEDIRILSDAQFLPAGLHVGQKQNIRGVNAHDMYVVILFVALVGVSEKSVLLSLTALVVLVVCNVAVDIIRKGDVLVGNRSLLAGALVTSNVGSQVHRNEIEFSAHVGRPAQRERTGMVKGVIDNAVGGGKFDAPVHPTNKTFPLWPDALLPLLLVVGILEPTKEMGSEQDQIRVHLEDVLDLRVKVIPIGIGSQSIRVVLFSHEAGKLEPGRHLSVKLVLANVQVDRAGFVKIKTLGVIFRREEHVSKVGNGFVQENRWWLC